MTDSPAQKFTEACLADRGYRFVRWEGTTAVWRFDGLRGSVEAEVDLNGQVTYTDEKKERGT
jgi:hypothetical protein